MTITRRDLLKNGLGAIGFCLSADQLLNLAAQAADISPLKSSRKKILVALQLSGGNDGLNMVVPYTSGAYYQARSTIALAAPKVLQLNNQVGFNPDMPGLHDLYTAGKVAVVQAVGYPRPNRSHFRSIDIWQTAQPDKLLETGWLGRYLDQCQMPADNLFPGVNVDPMLPKTLFGSTTNVPSVSSINDFKFRSDPRYAEDRRLQIQAFNDIYESYPLNRPAIDLLRKAGVDANRASDELFKLVNKYNSTINYPEGTFGNSLKFIAQMICGGLNSSVYGISLDGFDTHTNQAKQQNELLKQLSSGLSAFYADLQAHNLQDNVLVYTFSEFGRRVAENGAHGTDHGTAGPMLILGGRVKGGVYGDHANFSNLDNGDLKYQIDFRSVYSTILNKWLDADSKSVLSQHFEDIGFIG